MRFGAALSRRLSSSIFAVTLSGVAGYFIDTSSDAQATTTVTTAHSPKGSFDVRLSPSAQPTADGDELRVKVTLNNRTSGELDTALGFTLLDDTGEVWLPETITTPGRVPGKSIAVQDFIVPPGLPDGHYRLEVSTGSRSKPGEHPETHVQNVYLAISSGALSLPSPGDWLVKSRAMIDQNVPNPNRPNANPASDEEGSGDTQQTETGR
ncbi:MAG TPA: hypothetical protein VFS67_03405 [Polyangiaceae bacterium]|nr:hypothetical protein [Polyangiaceae bacterium]